LIVILISLFLSFFQAIFVDYFALSLLIYKRIRKNILENLTVSVACCDILLMSGFDNSQVAPLMEVLLWHMDHTDYFRIYHHCQHDKLPALVDSQSGSEQEAVVEQPPVPSSTQGASFLCLFQPSQKQITTLNTMTQNNRPTENTVSLQDLWWCVCGPRHSCRREQREMGSWWRSEEMEYVSVIVSEDAAHSCIRELGQMGKLSLTCSSGSL
jgi:hypothetical protein